MEVLERQPQKECASLRATTVSERREDKVMLVSELDTDVRKGFKLVEQVEAMMNKAREDLADVIVIGGGPGGYVAAIRIAQLGGRAIIIEKDELGGVCLNRGCIPTKAMIASADIYDVITRRSAEYGVNIKGEVSLDYTKVVERRRQVVKQLVSGVGYLVKKHNIQMIKGTARLASKTSVEVAFSDGRKEVINARNIIIATGSEPASVPIPGLEGENIWDSNGALAAEAIPERLLVIGGGAIGLEWGYIFRKFGSEVTIIELMSQVLPLNDSEIARELQKILQKKDGIRILTGTHAIKIEQKNEQMVTTIETGGKQEELITDKILVAVGRKPASSGLGLENLGIKREQGRILVDNQMKTNVAGTYAIGDVVGGMLLAHKASEEGIIAAENCMGHSSKMKYDAIPAAVYTTPEVANVGITEENAKKQGIDYKVGKFHFRANGKALGIGEPEGFVKIITDAKYGEILGCHMIGPHVTDLIHEVVVGMDAEATIEVLGRAVHGHPTLSEVTKEAALDAYGESIHKG